MKPFPVDDSAARHDSQVLVPDSFRALHSDRRGRLTRPAAEVAQRAELCEDLAQQLLDSARALHFDRGVAADLVLARLQQGLDEPEAGLQPGEARWVAGRVAELAGWEAEARALAEAAGFDPERSDRARA